MRTRDEIQAEMLKVAEALERPNLTPEQKSRGNARYDELEAELMFVINQERKAAEQESKTYQYPPDVQKHIDAIWKTLDPDGKRRRGK